MITIIVHEMSATLRGCVRRGARTELSPCPLCLLRPRQSLAHGTLIDTSVRNSDSSGLSVTAGRVLSATRSTALSHFQSLSGGKGGDFGLSVTKKRISVTLGSCSIESLVRVVIDTGLSRGRNI